jgi:hypothetical protein
MSIIRDVALSRAFLATIEAANGKLVFKNNMYKTLRYTARDFHIYCSTRAREQISRLKHRI